MRQLNVGNIRFGDKNPLVLVPALALLNRKVLVLKLPGRLRVSQRQAVFRLSLNPALIRLIGFLLILIAAQD